MWRHTACASHAACVRAQGKWKARALPNPNYYVEDDPMDGVLDIGAVALEVRRSTAFCCMHAHACARTPIGGVLCVLHCIK